MSLSIDFIITFFNNKFSIKIHRNIFYFIITYGIDVFCVRIYFSCLLHHIKLLFVIKMSCHHSYKIIKFHLVASILNLYTINPALFYFSVAAPAVTTPFQCSTAMVSEPKSHRLCSQFFVQNPFYIYAPNCPTCQQIFPIFMRFLKITIINAWK